MVAGKIDKNGIKIIKFPADGNHRQTAYLGKNSGLMDYEMKIKGEWIRLKTDVLDEKQVKRIKIADADNN